MALPSLTTTLLIFTVILIILPAETYAFGAGDIPDFAYLNDRAFRHGDIENILENLVKSVGGAAGGGLFGFAQSVISSAAGGSKFNKSDVKKVYFGNWLRDYSQAMDIAGLSKLTADSLLLVVSVLGFMTFGFATEEFQITADRLGVYLPVEHIDNPKGYAEKEGDARQFHPKLRPPVDPRELEIDERTGMKNYMATEDQGWDSSTAHIRRVFRSCIEYGRRARGQEGADLWEAYRLLGTGLHTMEDLLAHSNWCEIALRKMGHEQVFCHVGDEVVIDTPQGQAPPLVTGTFGGADFLFSLMGEATDHLSSASVTDLSDKMNQASQNGDDNASALQNIFSKLPIGGDDKMNQGEEMHAQAKAYNFDPDNIAPPEVQAQLMSMLKWRDDVYRDVLAKIEMIPGLTDLIDELTNALNAYVYTLLAPYLAPVLEQATGALNEGSKAVIDSDDQYQVFDNPNASDPSHSLLSKDHFGLILNEPAGKIAQLVVEHSVNLIVAAWADESDPEQIVDQILEAFHHPYYATGRSQIQHMMFEHMEKWLGGLGPEETEQTIQALTKESVRAGKNKRLGSEDETQIEAGYGGHSHGQGSYNSRQQASSGGGGYGSQQSYGQSQTTSSRRTETSYGQGTDEYASSQRYNESSGRAAYGETQGGDRYGSQHSNNENTYGSGRKSDTREDEYGSRRPARNQEENVYGGSGRTYGSDSQQEEPGYGSRRNQESYGGSQKESGYGGRRSDEEPTNTYGSRRAQESYGESQRESGYGGRRNDDEEPTNTYGSRRNEEGYGESGYGSRRNDEEPANTYGSSRTNRDNSEKAEGYGRRHNEDESSNIYGSGRGYGQDSERDEKRYNKHRDDDSNAYGSSRGYGEEKHSKHHGHRDEGDDEERSRGYGGSDEGESRRRREESSDDSSNRGEEEHRSSGHRKKKHNDSFEEQSGYTPSYGRGEDNSNETFGAERLNLDEERGASRYRNDNKSYY